MHRKSIYALSAAISSLLFFCFLIAPPVRAQEVSLETLFEIYKTERKLDCGARNTAIQTGRRIIEQHKNDADNQEVIRYVKKDVPEIIEKDRTCVRDNLYNPLYRQKYWQPFFELSKHIIADEGDKPIALDVTLTLVSVGHDRIVVDKADSYMNDTLEYAKLAIQKIETEQQKSLLGNWGVFVPFKTRENSLGWLNYIIGYIYLRQKQADEALRYFYKAAQFESDLRKEGTIYQIIGKYYFDRLDEASRTKYEIATDGEKHKTLMKAYAERALIAYAKAYKSAVERSEVGKSAFDIKAQKKISEALYREITNLYAFRFNLAPDETTAGLDEFILKLIDQPLPDPATPLDPIFEAPLEIKLKRNKSQ